MSLGRGKVTDSINGQFVMQFFINWRLETLLVFFNSSSDIAEIVRFLGLGRLQKRG
jgi:hypothetical protein